MSHFADPPLSLSYLLEALPDGIAFVDEYGVICHVNGRLEALSGYRSAGLVGQALGVLLQSLYRDAHAARRGVFTQDPRSRTMAPHLGCTLVRQDGGELTVDVARAPFAFNGKTWIVVVVRDHSFETAAGHLRTEAELHALATELAGVEALANSEKRFRLAFEDNMTGMICVDPEDRVLAVNDSFCQIVGRSREEIVAKGAAPFTHPKEVRRRTNEVDRRLASGVADHLSYVDRYMHKDGRAVVVQVAKSRGRDAEGATLHFVISARDITEERAHNAELSQQALHDSLTGLASRLLFEDRLSQVNARAVRRGGWNAVLMLDLDDFKGLNDTLGCQIGDLLLVAAARRLEEVTRSSDTLCRLRGDEFLYLAEGLEFPAQAEKVAARLLGAVAEPFSLAGTRLEQRASIGIVAWEGKSKDFTELLQDADVALCDAKRQGEG